MVRLTIDGREVTVPEGTSILEAALQNGVSIPHLCYLKKLNEIGACRLCSVEVEGEDKLIPACITKVEEGMKVTTNSMRVRQAAKTNLSFIMTQHDGRCSQCVRSGNCQLQTLCSDLSVNLDGYYENIPSGKQIRWPKNFALVRDNTKCIKCMRCIQVCDKIQDMHVWDLVNAGAWARVDVAGARRIEEADCTLCGQCITVCPTAALRERDDTGLVFRCLENPDIVTVAQIAPAIRTAWGEELGMSPEKATVNRLAGVLKAMGFDYVFDTSFGADLTIMEEASEFLARKNKGDLAQYPMFTSCCPGWVRFVKARYPQLTGQLSTSKSPHTMFGAVIKTYFAQKMGIDPAKIRVVSIMPCIAKKHEAALPTERNINGLQDVDYVLTTREVVRMIRADNLEPERIEEAAFDRVCGDYTGAGVIFGVTGGVMEAALRSAYYMVTGKNPDPDLFRTLRGGRMDTAWREAEAEIGGSRVRVAVASGLHNADLLCRAILRGEVHYDFVEVMACPNGCAGGGGQPLHQDDIDRRFDRGEVLHRIDGKMKIRFSHENPDIQMLYNDYLEKPLSPLAEEILHTDHFGWEMKD
ncbi:MAG: [FeFe] hydrogenase, group A [Lachnospiraceae bacterium]|nr:[FeFe] hydrogenase, group A [Lachnospiraceae bacterium]